MNVWIVLTALVVGQAYAFLKEGKIDPENEPKFFPQKLDHFSFTTNTTFRQRYAINQTPWKSGGPIFCWIPARRDNFLKPADSVSI